MAIPNQPIPKRMFEPIEIGRYRLSNRIVMAPMTRCRAVDWNVPSTLAPIYYSQRASAGLIITEATQPSEAAQGYWRTPGIHGERHVEVWRAVAQGVHARQGRIFMQLWHNGRIFHPDSVPPHLRPYGPSAVQANVRLMTPKGLQQVPTPIEMSEADIAAAVADFVAGARRAIDCGIDGVELHAANGYLFEQFLNRSSNRRTDRYGGSIENRARMLRETVEAVSAAIGADRVGVRISPLGSFNDMSDPDPVEIYRHVVTMLAGQNLAYLHVIRPAVSGSLTVAEARPDPLPDIRRLYPGTLIVAGDLDVVHAERMLESGLADAVGFGRWFISNPDLPERLRHGCALAEADRATFYTPGPDGYIDYPACARHGQEPAMHAAVPG